MNTAQMDAMRVVLNDIIDERKRQDERWGVQRLEWPVWMAVLTEEVGESAEASLEAHFNPQAPLGHLREELVQVAAVAVAMIEHIDEINQRNDNTPVD